MFNVELLRDAVIIHVDDDLDLFTQPKLSEAIRRAEEGPAERIIVSLVTCNYSSSACMRILKETSDRLGKRFFVVVPPKTLCARIVELLALSDKSFIVKTIDDAMDTPLPA